MNRRQSRARGQLDTAGTYVVEEVERNANAFLGALCDGADDDLRTCERFRRAAEEGREAHEAYEHFARVSASAAENMHEERRDTKLKGNGSKTDTGRQTSPMKGRNMIIRKMTRWWAAPSEG